MPATADPARRTTLVLSGGVALGAYEAGAYAALAEAGAHPTLIAAASAGAINAALIAGNPPERRAERLRAFWGGVASDPAPALSFWAGARTRGTLREGYNAAGVLQTLMLGRPGLFHPRLLPRAGNPGLYDLAPLRLHLEQLVDFGLLNGGATRLRIASTDVLSGERVVFDTAERPLGPEHILASCSLLPLYPPVELDGRLLGDGALTGNAPVDLALDDPGPDHAGPGDLDCFVVDLYARRGSRPRTLGAAAARALDVIFASQTHAMLDAHRREGALRAALAAVAGRLPPGLRDDPGLAPLLARGSTRAATVLLLGYRAGLDEAGPGKGFDFTAATLAERWEGGAAHVRAALDLLRRLPSPRPPGVTVHEVEG